MDSRHLHQDCCIETEIDKNKEPENDGKNEGKSGGVIADCWLLKQELENCMLCLCSQATETKIIIIIF